MYYNYHQDILLGILIYEKTFKLESKFIKWDAWTIL